MNYFKFTDRFIQSMKKDLPQGVAPDAAMLTPKMFDNTTSAKKRLDEDQFVKVFERCLQKSLYEDYTYMPRWALWS